MKKKIITILLCGFLIICLTSCGNKELEEPDKEPFIGEEATTEIVTDKKIELSIKDGTLTNTGATVVLSNKSNREYMYGLPYSIQIKQDGKWHIINAILNFDLPLFSIASGETKEIDLNWESSYGKLEKGTYRIIKEIEYKDEKDKDENFFIAVEFNIDNN